MKAESSPGNSEVPAVVQGTSEVQSKPRVTTPRKGASGFIPEVQGLRTVALILVAVFHIWFGKVSGGVDIFLLVSAYLMTRSLVAKSEAGSITKPVQFLINKFARLLPAAAASIALTILAVFLFMPLETWRGSAGDALASLGYYQNFHLQQAAVDYFNADHSAASPFQHFWSLSVQGQVFVLWAVIHFVGDLISRVVRISPRLILLSVFLAIGVAHFMYSVDLTASNQAYAYFDTGARLWEFAAGSLLAIIQPWIRISTWLRVLLGWAGVIGMVSCGFVLPVQSSFPGVAALWPVVSAALVILSAGAPTRFGADRLLARGVLNKVGSYTYALYLVHWPVLVIFLAVTNSERATFPEGLLVLAGSAVLSVLITRLVERPSSRWVSRATAVRVDDSPARSGVRTAPRFNPRAILVVVASLLVGAVPAQAMEIGHEKQLEARFERLDDLDYATIGANNPDFEFPDGPTPDWAIVKDDWASLGDRCDPDDPYFSALCYTMGVAADDSADSAIASASEPESETGSASELKPRSEPEPERRVLIVGSSHATQFAAVLTEVINRHPTWEFRAQVGASCYYHMRVGMGASCEQTWDAATAYIDEVQPDLVVVHGTVSKGDLDEGMNALFEWLEERKKAAPDTSIVVLRDNPRTSVSMSECAQEKGIDSPACTYRVAEPTLDEYGAAIEATGAIWMDLTESICPDYVCRPVVGGVVTYFDRSHLTNTFERTLSGEFSARINKELEWWPKDPYEGEYLVRSGKSDVVEGLNDEAGQQ